MPASYSPLRYPGGKAVLYKFLAEIIEENELQDGVYVEPYAGGAGAALNLLFAEHVERIMINDADRYIYAFWNAVLNQTDRFLKLIDETPITVDEWKQQREIYRTQKRHSNIRVAFATFYLNRCNRSGILMRSGVIGGPDQTGEWKIDARFNKDELAHRIERIAMYRDRIELHGLDAMDFLRNHVTKNPDASRALVYLDPPYYAKGSQLYLNHYTPRDHNRLARYIRPKRRLKWIMTYDDVPEIHELYATFNRVHFNLNYSAHTARPGNELLVWPDHVELPRNYGSPAVA